MNKRPTEPYLATYFHKLGREKGLPIAGNFELTGRCNFNCPMCYVHTSDPENIKKELTAEQWISLAESAVKNGMIFCLLTGGEPFVRKDFFEIYGALKKMGVLVSINSNGSLLDGEIRQRLLDDPPLRLNVSIYGSSNDTYKNMCGTPSFDKVIENVKALKKGGIDVRANLSITPYNVDDIEEIIKICNENNILIKASSYMYPPIRIGDGECDRFSRLTAEQSAAATLKWDLSRFTPEEFKLRAESMIKFGKRPDSDCPTELDSGVSCRAGSTSFWVTYDGKMTPCGMMPTPVTEPMKTGFEEAWRTLTKATSEIRLPGKCAGCKFKEMCGVCAAICFSETGSFDKAPEYSCKQTEHLYRLTLEKYERLKEEESENKKGTD